MSLNGEFNAFCGRSLRLTARIGLYRLVAEASKKKGAPPKQTASPASPAPVTTEGAQKKGRKWM